MSHPPHLEPLAKLAREARAAERRLRARAAIDVLPSSLALAAIVAAPAIALARTASAAPAWLVRDVLVACVISIVARVAFAASRRLAPLAGALSLDRAHALEGRVAAALDLAGARGDERSAFVALAIDDAAARAESVSARVAVPLRTPRELLVPLALLVATASLAFLRVPRPRPPAPVETTHPALLGDDDVELFRDASTRLAERVHDEALRAEVGRLNQLVEDLAARRLDRGDAFKRLAAIEAALRTKDAVAARDLDAELRERAKPLRGSDLSRPLAEALEKHDLAAAEKAMRDAAARLRASPTKTSKADLERLREAMRRAAESAQQRRAALDERRKRLADELLERRAARGDAGADEDERLLERRERELERLDRARDELDRASRRLDRLDRDLARAAEDLLSDVGAAADDLERGAEDLNRMGADDLTDAERDELARKIEELREELRRSGSTTEERKQALSRFLRSARGARGADAPRKTACPESDPSCEQGQGDAEPRGEGGQGGEGADGGTPTFEVGKNGERVLVVRKTSRASSDGSRGGDDSTRGAGRDYGTGHDPNLVGRPTDPGLRTLDVAATGADTGQGASRSEVIFDAAERGFGGGAYRRVFTEYKTTREAQMHGDKLAPGAAAHVERYFDLIRPRGDATTRKRP